MKLVGRDAVIDKLVYAATNPVLDDLVDRVHLWHGVNGLAALLNGCALRATRPLHFFRRDGSIPDALEIPLAIPPELGPAAQVISELRDRVRAIEEQRAAERLRTGRRVLSRRAVLAQSWRERPTTCEPHPNLRPQVASRSRWARIEALLRNRAFAAEYADARERWRAGIPAVFPPGTYCCSGSHRSQCFSGALELIHLAAFSRASAVMRSGCRGAFLTHRRVRAACPRPGDGLAMLRHGQAVKMHGKPEADCGPGKSGVRRSG